MTFTKIQAMKECAHLREQLTGANGRWKLRDSKLRQMAHDRIAYRMQQYGFTEDELNAFVENKK